MLQRIYRKLYDIFSNRFDKTGERVDITYSDHIDFEKLDMYEKSHLRRYEFATNAIGEDWICGDFACGTGYGSVMLSKKSKRIVGADINEKVIDGVRKRYNAISNVTFLKADLLALNIESEFDAIISFETIEHFPEEKIPLLLDKFNGLLKAKGKLIFSTPYMQDRSDAALKLGHHLTFYINEEKIERWLSDAGFSVVGFEYQNYDTHIIRKELDKKDFIICIALKN